MVFGLSIGDSVQQGFDAFFEFIPNLIGFLVILIVGLLIARAVRGLVAKGLEKLGMDRALHESDAGQYVEKVSPDSRPSKLIGTVVFWLIFLFVASAAIGALEIPAVTSFMDSVLTYLPNVIAAIVIFVLAAAIAGAVGGAIHKLMGDTPTGRLLRAAAPSLIMVVAVFMVLNQLKIAEEIVTITYAAILGAVALGMALAFGLGGRDVAGRMLEDAYDKGREKKDDVKDDLETAKDRGQQKAEEAKNRAQGGPSQEPGPAGGPGFSAA